MSCKDLTLRHLAQKITRVAPIVVVLTLTLLPKRFAWLEFTHHLPKVKKSKLLSSLHRPKDRGFSFADCPIKGIALDEVYVLAKLSTRIII
jgi:hypothetical protein